MLKNIQKKASKLVEKGLIKRKAETFTAVNIGSYFIKGIVVKSGQITDCFIKIKKDLPEAIEELKVDKNIPTKKVKISLKSPDCLVRYFSFPKTEKRKLKEALYYQLNKLIPYSPDEVYFDYIILKQLNSSQNQILLAVAKKKHIDLILKSFAKKGFSISEITLDSISLINLYLDKYPESSKINSCILDIGHSFSTMNILEEGLPFFSREVKFSTKDLVEIITRIKNISEKEAIDVLSKINKKNDLFTILEENISDWCKEIKHSFDFFELNKGKSLDKLYITGGLAAIPNIADIFSENLEIDSEILIPDESNSLNFSENFSQEKYKNYRHNLAVTFGLVL
ncbi:MAG: pilus assembly protein PilM [Candidatus Omnitrophica bacterium]|nr:pilus assembly protein PilM [Candidatus Omnitrophota bacterium]MCF7893664.1 pilus assembly protein PilM [Candidatus Omnitrophota bacterium]